MVINLSRKIVYPSLQREKEKIRLEEEFLTRLPYTIEKEYIPKDAHEFYTDFGYLVHPRTGQTVKELTDYQYEIWNCPAKTILVDKSQKSGITTSELIHDFQELLLNGKGKDLLIVGQTEKAAIEHLYTLKRLIIDSPKYRKYLITKSSELFFREEQTKVGTLFIKNPDNPYRPMRIIGLGFIVSALWSWKNVFRIHMSDPAAAQVVDDAPIYAALMSRLTNTDGRMMIEGPPRGPYGRFYELYEQFKSNDNSNAFKVFLVTIYDALREGLVTKEFIDKAKVELGQLYPQTYEGSFIAGVGNIFEPSLIDQSIKLGEQYKDIDISKYSLLLVGIDWGFGSSKTAIVACERLKDEGMIVVRMAEEHTHADPQDIVNICFNLYRKYWNTWFWCDGSNRAATNLMKVAWDESLDWETDDINPQTMKILPVNFMKEHKTMLQHLHVMISKGYLAIPSKFEQLLIGLRTAQAREYSLQKDVTSYDDSIDALRLSLKGFSIR